MTKTRISLLLFIIIVFSCVSLNAQISLEKKIAQMLMVGYYDDSNFKDTLYYDIQYRNLGGVIYFARNIESPSQVSDQTASFQSLASVPLLVSIDEEGGIVARLDETNGFEKTKTAYQLGTIINSEDTTRAEASKMANWLLNSGININLAPVVDVNVNENSPAIGYYGRSFSNDPDEVYKHSLWYIDEFDKLNIHTVLKHFPGHGSAEDDSHNGFTDVSNTWTSLELLPYKKLFDDGYNDIVMSAHIFNSNLDDQYPASLSKKIITGLLRDSLGFSGAVISDELFMNAITDNYGFDESIVLAINAGTDILLFRRNDYNDRSLVDYVVRLVKQKISEGEISESRIEESYQRVLNLKSSITSITKDRTQNLPNSFALSAYPNPFNISTNLVATLNKKANINLKIFDILGRLVWNRELGRFNRGIHTIIFDASGLSSGTYIAVIQADKQVEAIKINLLK